MVQKEAQREMEAELTQPDSPAPWMNREKDGLEKGVILVKGKERPHVLNEQGYIKRLSTPVMENTASNNMMVFIHRIIHHSGRHKHQGGYSLFVLEGKGYTTVDGVRNDWEEGDLILLPIKTGGVEHQHFNEDPKGASRWMALVSRPLVEILSRRVEQKQVHPDWKRKHGDKTAVFEDGLKEGQQKGK
ncbi:MAG: cupin domain-containing protein [Candidatus Tectomicrobia bacterium]|uniref:Cupin domain-containing protein n=1 Tax=Tectimicrobiota bacterium TaxID=2528274 RepID=A0A933GKM9_UNCTE|nr:cupin domain-containing protein [Candidatus Tectomicrobia bacterium]